LDPVITITEAGNLYKHLQSYIDSVGDVTIDASKVQMIDMAGLQLLLVFARELGKFQRKVHWQNPSSVFRQAAELMDLSKCLRL
jgi:ABC-type transporter Mla MlaB component